MFDQLKFIKEQLAQRGKEISFQQTRHLMLEAGVRRMEIGAYNQHWYLASLNAIPVGTTISSDTNVLVVSQGMNPESLHEFTGQLIIELPNDPLEPVFLEFIQILTK
jgi:hypothetical protein